jgi:hypothetical protein
VLLILALSAEHTPKPSSPLTWHAHNTALECSLSRDSHCPWGLGDVNPLPLTLNRTWDVLVCYNFPSYVFSTKCPLCIATTFFCVSTFTSREELNDGIHRPDFISTFIPPHTSWVVIYRGSVLPLTHTLSSPVEHPICHEWGHASAVPDAELLRLIYDDDDEEEEGGLPPLKPRRDLTSVDAR